MCRAHGGAAPQVKKSAGERLFEAAEPAAARLVKALKSKDERVAIKASGMILDRGGHAPSRRIEIEDSDQVLARVLGLSRDQLPALEDEKDKEAGDLEGKIRSGKE